MFQSKYLIISLAIPFVLSCSDQSAEESPQKGSPVLQHMYTYDAPVTALAPYDRANAISATNDGGWIAAGYTTTSTSQSDMMLWKFTSEGELDTGFSGGGILQLDNPAGVAGSGVESIVADEATDIIATSDGGYLVVGTAYGNGKYIVALKLNANGEFDSNFNGSGAFTSAYGLNITGLHGIETSNGDFVIAGSFSDYSSAFVSHMYVIKVTKSGQLDTAFQDSGEYWFPAITDQSREAIVRDIAPSADGGWIIAGRYVDSNEAGAAVWKFTASGDPDINFGNNGQLVIPDSSTTKFQANSIARVNNGWVATGSGSFSALAVWKITDLGTLDSTFYQGGLDNRGYAITATPDGGWLAVGTMGNGHYYDMGMWKFTANGKLDSRFSQDGIFHHNKTNSVTDSYEAHGVAIAADGSWIVAGYSLVVETTRINGNMETWQFK